MADKAPSPEPSVQWDGKTFKIIMPLGPLPKGLAIDESFVLETEIEPAIVYVVRMRELGKDQWGPGFITPFTHCNFRDLKPNTEYELQVTAKNKAWRERTNLNQGQNQCTRELGKRNPVPQQENVNDVPFGRKRWLPRFGPT